MSGGGAGTLDRAGRCGDAAAMAAEARDLAPSRVAREVAAILRRHRLAALVPALVLGAGAGAVVLVRHDLGATIAVGLALAIVFELYVGYAERIVAADRAGRPPRMGTLLREAATLTPALVGASAIAVALPLAATGLLVIPGVWLLTRWSLFAPAIVHEGLGPRASLARSAALVRGAAWPVAATATASVVIEHAVIHATAHTAEPLLGSTLLALAVAALATAAVSPPAAFTISVVYERRLAATSANG